MRARRLVATIVLVLAAPAAGAAADLDQCSAARPAPLLPTDRGLCSRLAAAVRHPSALPLDRYEAVLGDFLRGYCHRDTAAGWVRDKGLRDTGPYTATLENGSWVGAYHGTHAPVVVWYSPDMIAWMRRNRSSETLPADGGTPEPVPAGAIIVKEMFPSPAAPCAAVPPERLEPTSGAAVMVRDPAASRDGWFWGWFGWQKWSPDWPAIDHARYPYMGFGQYCTNCHASAASDLTFSSLRNVAGTPGEPLTFLSQTFFATAPVHDHHVAVADTSDDPVRYAEPRTSPLAAFLAAFGRSPVGRTPSSIVPLPSQTYDNAWMPAGPPRASGELVTSDQCIGCHDAGGTGLQLDMTAPDGKSGLLLNLSPYATWRTSPMGLAGRDPIFYAQLASETGTFHSSRAGEVQSVCFGCHGVAGARQQAIDPAPGDDCPGFTRQDVDAVPWPDDNPQATRARYGALARDGITCTACHRMLVGVGDGPALAAPENRCIQERQQLLNPNERGFARTFTGSFLLRPPSELAGPFPDPKPKPMENGLGVTPVEDQGLLASELCGSCHVVHLPVYAPAGRPLGRTYEQTTYSEWAFSAYRVGTAQQRPLPSGAGAQAQSCQGCHMPNQDADGHPYRGKIAGIQEHSNFPEADHALGGDDLDLAVRSGYARHTLVGLNLFLLEMVEQFPALLGMRTQDPMLVDRGLDPVLLSARAVREQAASGTASVAVREVRRDAETLSATVSVISKVGHKLPSGVGFRRAFLTFEVLDGAGKVLWASGRSDDAGLLVDAGGQPLPGELWWTADCSRRLHPDRLVYQPHYQVITREDQAQIYQELVTAPASSTTRCGDEAPPAPPFTTSFLSICAKAKDNRILPAGFLPLRERVAIARALGADATLAHESGPYAVGDDPDYVHGGGDSLTYRVPLDAIPGATQVRATLYYQATPPFFLQDRFCTSQSADTERLFFLTSHLRLDETPAAGWKLRLATATADVE